MSGYGWGWRKEQPIGPPPGIGLIDKLVDHFEPTELERRRREFIAANPDDPVVKASLRRRPRDEGCG
jgi:hypothetical protein